MDNQIVVMLNPIELKQTVYIFTEESETTPLVEQVPLANLIPYVAMNAAKYKITNIRLGGNKNYAEGIKQQIENKIEVCFDNIQDFKITLIADEKKENN